MAGAQNRGENTDTVLEKRKVQVMEVFADHIKKVFVFNEGASERFVSKMMGSSVENDR